MEKLISKAVRIEPLITFRILFGALMMVGAIRFMLSGWVERLYVEPQLFFKFYGFHWVEVFDQTGMYFLYSIIALSAAGIMLGLFYRFSAMVFFLSFSYAELTDATNYLNHYYLVGLLALLLIFLPAHRSFSLDIWRKPEWKVSHIPAWCIHILILQVTIVYFYAGFAKLNEDWLFRAMPLVVWLPTKADFPLLGFLFEKTWVAYAFSWFGAFYDLTIAFFLMYRKTRPWAYLAVIAFHVMTKMLFNIGLFPMIMIFNTLIFFSPEFHERLLGWIGYKKVADTTAYPSSSFLKTALRPTLMIYFAFQLLFPLRYLLYSGNVLWTEEGYRFAWRVMLVEKVGQATFYVQDGKSLRRSEVVNSQYLTPYQEKQMAIQPDLILQFAHFLAQEYQEKHAFENPIVTVASYVALNGRASQQFIDPTVNLAKKTDSFAHKDWILSHNQ